MIPQYLVHSNFGWILFFIVETIVFQMALIEEQQSAINNLKTNLMDELNERGILSDPECQKVLDRHKKVGSMEAM